MNLTFSQDSLRSQSDLTLRGWRSTSEMVGERPFDWPTEREGSAMTRSLGVPDLFDPLLERAAFEI
jgi:hypothetical protein